MNEPRNFSYWTRSNRFDPRRDEDAAIKFVLDQILSSDRLRQFVEVVTGNGTLDGMGGDPAWLFDRRNEQSNAYDDAIDWPEGACFRAYVDPDTGYWLDHPEFFMTREAFFSYLSPALDAYETSNPALAETPEIIALREALGATRSARSPTGGLESRSR